MENLGNRRLASAVSMAVSVWIRFARETIPHGKSPVGPLAYTLCRVIRSRPPGRADITDDVVVMKYIVPGELAASPDFRQPLKATYVMLGGADGTGNLSILARTGPARTSTICRDDLLAPSPDTASPPAPAMASANCSGIIRLSGPPRFICATARLSDNLRNLQSIRASRRQSRGPADRAEGIRDVPRSPCRAAHAKSPNIGYIV